MNRIMYSKGKKDEIRVWEIKTLDNGEYEVIFGVLNGKMQSKKKQAKPKNIGKINETTAKQQAELEAESLILKQYDKGYRGTIEEAIRYEAWLPMLAHDYTKNKHNISYPCFISPKLDGLRALSKVVDGEVTLTTRGGKTYPCPEHIREALLEIYYEYEIDSLDGELYCHGMKLQDIVSTVKSETEDIKNIKFFVFDLPVKELPWERRMHVLKGLKEDESVIINKGISIVPNYFADNEEFAYSFLLSSIRSGFEGIMLRNIYGLYLFDFRSRDLLKWKLMQDSEALVLDVSEDGNGEGVLLCKMKDSDLTFECKMKGDYSFRCYENQKTLIGKWITYKYQALTNLGKPQFPVGLYVRNCDVDGNPVE